MTAALVKVDLLIPKLTVIATDGAPAMNEFVNGIVRLCKADQTFPELEFPLLHPKGAARAQIIDLDNVMRLVMEIANYIRTNELSQMHFKHVIAGPDQGLPDDLPLHCTVRWLPKGKVISLFFELLDAVKLLMEKKDKDYSELSDLKGSERFWSTRCVSERDWTWRCRVSLSTSDP